MKSPSVTPSHFSKRRKSPHTFGRILIILLPFVDILIPSLAFGLGKLHRVHELVFFVSIPIRLFLIWLLWRGSKEARLWLGAWSCLGILLTWGAAILAWANDQNGLLPIVAVQFFCVLYTFWLCYSSDEVKSLQHHVRRERGL